MSESDVERAPGVEAALREPEAAATPPHSAVAPRFSVVVPLESHRGFAVRGLRSWACEQTFPRDRFEIVIASPRGFSPVELREIRRLLAPQDRILELDHAHDIALCAAAVDAARGELLFFTESHCLAAADALERADDCASRHGEWAGFSCRSLPIVHNRLSRAEAALYGRDIDYAMNVHPWRKVLDQCFVIRRDAYLAAGGFEPKFGHFGEWLLAARLHDLGSSLGYEPGVVVHHLYPGRFGEWKSFTRDFLEGQLLFHAGSAGDPAASLFEEVPEWCSRSGFRRDAARRMCRMLLHDLGRRIAAGPRSAARRSSGRYPHWGRLACWSSRALFGSLPSLLGARARHVRARAALLVDLARGDAERAARDLARCCEITASIVRIGFVRRMREEPAAVVPQEAARPSGCWYPATDVDIRGVGFHLASGEGAEAIRWSEPAAYVELPLARGRHHVDLHWLFPPLAGTGTLSFFLDERPIPADQVRVREDRAELRLDVISDAASRIGWVCHPQPAPGDDRPLGVPVTRLAWTAVDRDARPPTGSPKPVEPAAPRSPSAQRAKAAPGRRS